MFDMHVHTNFSGDSDMKPEEAVKRAIDLNLKGIAFTDHLDIDYPGYDDYFMINFDEYVEFMGKLKDKYRNVINIIVGIEVGLQPHIYKQTNDILKNHNFDYVIGSIHIVDYTDLHNGDFTRIKTKPESYLKYFESVFNQISNFEDFDTLGHIDLIRRYGDYEDKTVNYMDYEDILDNILKKLISQGKTLEVNTSSYRYGLDSPMPDFQIMKRYRELGGEQICISSDAHSLDFIAYKFEYIKEMLINAGFRYTTYYEKRKCKFTKL